MVLHIRRGVFTAIQCVPRGCRAHGDVTCSRTVVARGESRPCGPHSDREDAAHQHQEATDHGGEPPRGHRDRQHITISASPQRCLNEGIATARRGIGEGKGHGRDARTAARHNDQRSGHATSPGARREQSRHGGETDPTHRCPQGREVTSGEGHGRDGVGGTRGSREGGHGHGRPRCSKRHHHEHGAHG